MPFHNAPRCTHIKVTGHPCKSPALRGKNFCYFHERVLRGVASPINPRIAPTFILEDHESIQCALMEIMNMIVLGRIEHKPATLLLRALNIAERNARRARFHENPKNMVNDIPNYGRQYLDEHPEYDEPAPQTAGLEKEEKEEKEEEAVSRPQANPPQPQPAYRKPPTPPIDKREPMRVDLREIRDSIQRAHHGSLPDLKKCFQAAGIFPIKSTTTIK